MSHHVMFEMTSSTECHITLREFVGLFTSMSRHVLFEITSMAECFIAFGTFERLFPCMSSQDV